MSPHGWVSWVLTGLGSMVLASSCVDANDEPPPSPSVTSAGAASREDRDSAGGNFTEAGAPALTRGRADGLPWLGSSCREAKDCGEQGLRCLTGEEDFVDGQGAPAGGMCTTTCEADDDCRRFDATAVCATLAEAPLVLAYAAKRVPRLCVPGCSLGAPSGPNKCHGRPDMACRPFAPDRPSTCFLKTDVCPEDTLCYRGACRKLGCGPRCNADRDCSAGRHCNPFTGLCDEAEAEHVPVGAECDTNASATGCGGGNCLEVDDAEGTRIKRMCTQSCTIGQVCADGAGACVWPRFQDFAVGDIGYCIQRCDCDGDCDNPADRCLPWGDADTEEAYGSRGACDYPSDGAVTLTCDEGGAAGAGGATNHPGAGGSADL